MRIPKIILAAAVSVLFSPWTMAQSVRPLPSPDPIVPIPVPEQVFDISSVTGEYRITPARCFPDTCKPQVGQFKGQFTATIVNKRVYISNQQIASTGNDFELPANPYLSEGGVQANAQYKLSETEFAMEGKVDSRAFDGPLVEYRLRAKAQPAITQTPKFNPLDYYLVRQDFRKCAYPMCGGIFVKSVNQRATRCADGSVQAECYVGEPIWEKLGFDPFSVNPNNSFNTQLLIRGKLSPSDNPIVGRLGTFVGLAAYRPANDSAPQGVFYGLENKGIFCITSPCFGIDEYQLNSTRVLTISDIDFTGVKATEEDLATAYLLMGEGEVIPAAGVNKRVRQLGGIGIKMVAQQFYLPLSAKFEVCPEGYSESAVGCVTKNGCAFPQIELTAIGGAEPLPGIPAPINTSCVDACEFPAELTSPGYCQVYYP
jgi:hypothetical protein